MEKLLDSLKKAFDFLKEKANTLKNLFLKLDLIKKVIVIASISAVVVAAIAIPLFAGGNKKTDNSIADDNNADSPKAVGIAFMEACINQDGVTACSLMPDFRFDGNKDEFVTQYTEALKYFIKTYYTNYGMELDFEHRQTYINLDDQEKSEIVQNLKKYSGFDETKVQDYSCVTVYLLKSLNGDTPVEEYQEITLIKYDGKWVVVDYSWPT